MTFLSYRPNSNYNITYPYVYWDGWFSEEEIQAIERYCATTGELTTGTIVTDVKGSTDESVRKSEVCMHHITPENQWFFDKMLNLTDHINKNFYSMDLLGFEFFQYTEYRNKGAKYDRHMDMIMGDRVPPDMKTPRKLSMSLILSDESEYTGGEFEFDTGGKNPEIALQKRGRVLAFPSYVIHAVKPVKKGTRRSIVIWCLGPKFK
jgi:PKHD-type hydroxylase